MRLGMRCGGQSDAKSGKSAQIWNYRPENGRFRGGRRENFYVTKDKVKKLRRKIKAILKIRGLKYHQFENRLLLPDPPIVVKTKIKKN